MLDIYCNFDFAYKTGVDTDLSLTTVRRHVLTEDDGWCSGHPEGEVSQDRCQDGSPFLMPPDTEHKTQPKFRRRTYFTKTYTKSKTLRFNFIKIYNVNWI